MKCPWCFSPRASVTNKYNGFCGAACLREAIKYGFYAVSTKTTSREASRNRTR